MTKTETDENPVYILERA